MVRYSLAHARWNTSKSSLALKLLASLVLGLSGIGALEIASSGTAWATPSMPPTAGTWYVEDVNTTTAYNTGCSHADYANQVGTGGLVILDFGAQVNSSTNVEINNNLISDSQIQSMVVAYAQGYYNCSLGNSVSVAVGT